MRLRDLLEARSAWEDQQEKLCTWTSHVTRMPSRAGDPELYNLIRKLNITYRSPPERDRRPDHSVTFTGTRSDLQRLINFYWPHGLGTSADTVSRSHRGHNYKLIKEALSAWEDQEEERCTWQVDNVSLNWYSKVTELCRERGITVKPGSAKRSTAFTGSRGDLRELIDMIFAGTRYPLSDAAVRKHHHEQIKGAA